MSSLPYVCIRKTPRLHNYRLVLGSGGWWTSIAGYCKEHTPLHTHAELTMHLLSYSDLLNKNHQPLYFATRDLVSLGDIGTLSLQYGCAGCTWVEISV